MRLTEIEVIAGERTLIQANLQAPSNNDRHIIKAIYGLDADELIPKFYSFGLESQDPFYRLSLKPREIVMRLVLSPNWDLGEGYSDLRDELYKGISMNRSGEFEIQFKDGPTVVAKTTGHIRKFEVPHMNKDAELQITFECEDPFFHGVTTHTYIPADFDSTGFFELNDHYTTAPHGVELWLDVINPIPSITIQDSDTLAEWRFQITPNGGFLAGDTVYINSYTKGRKVELNRGGDYTGLMNAVTSDSVWPIIFPGDNDFYSPEIAAGDAFYAYVQFTSRFWGV